MRLIKRELQSFLSFSRKEFNGLLVFCFLVLLVLFFPRIYQWLNPPEVFSFNEFKAEISAIESVQTSKQTYSYEQLKNETEENEVSFRYFKFDPNGLSISSWQQLGLTSKQIKVIKNYESKGGRFYKKEDLKKIYSISPRDYARLEPHINIPGRITKSNYEYKQEHAKPLRAAILVELNSADSALLETIYGIGPAFASRIIKYRNRLGGFYSKEQLTEVYGIDSAKFIALQGQVVVNTANIRQININTALFDDLKAHPYLSYKQMNAIIQYRKQHGNYNGPRDLKKVAVLSDETISKLSPYLSF